MDKIDIRRFEALNQKASLNASDEVVSNAETDQLWRLLESDFIQVNTEEGWAKLSTKINTPSNPSRFSLLKWAASIMVLLSVSIYLYQASNQEEMVIISSKDHHVIHLLPDNSTVKLTEHSEIRYPEEFSDRVVEISGAAFFNVAKDAGRSFRVLTDDMTVKVLGTSFSVEAGSKKQKVAVATGLVSVGIDNQNFNLKAKEGLIYYPENRKYRKYDQISGIESNLTDNQLIFKDQDLREVIETLAYHFDTEIILKSKSIANCKVTGQFSNKEKLDSILHQIATALDLTFKSVDNQIEISGPGC